MPAQNEGQVIQRQCELLRLIPSHELLGRTAAELSTALFSRGYAVTWRTIERDLEGLALCTPLNINELERPQRWHKSRALDVPGMEVAKATTTPSFIRENYVVCKTRKSVPTYEY